MLSDFVDSLRPRYGKRIVVAVLLACALSGGCAASTRAMAYWTGACAFLDPVWTPILWWLYDCGDPATGGGGSGAGN